MSDAELGRYDIAAVNLACAVGLPGAEAIDIASCLQKLDAWAEQVRIETQLAWGRFHRNPANWDGSQALFKVHHLVSVLQSDFGVRYNPAKMAADAPFFTEDSFVHGITHGLGGTCASLPVVYAAVGRRLRYPLKLVSALGPNCGHCFLRWDEPDGERFNIEINNTGLNAPPDDYYRTGVYSATRKYEAAYNLLRSRTPRQELAGFLAARGWRWLDAGNHREAADAFIRGSLSDPLDGRHPSSVLAVLQLWKQKLTPLIPPLVPELRIQFPPRRYPTIPESIERDVIALAVLEDLLTDPRHRERWWDPQRRSPDRPPRIPSPHRSR
jgi:hypothetical protein